MSNIIHLTEPMFGYKGFDKGLKCKDYQYKKGLNIHDGVIQRCVSGFHFCKTLEQVDTYYNLDKDYEYYTVMVPAGSNVIKNNNKYVTDQLYIMEKVDALYLVSKSEARKMINKAFKEAIKYDAVITGSIALMLYGIIPIRKPSDIDLIVASTPNFEKGLNPIWHTSYEEQIPDKLVQIHSNGTKIDLFFNPWVPHVLFETDYGIVKIADWKYSLTQYMKVAVSRNSKWEEIKFISENMINIKARLGEGSIIPRLTVEERNARKFFGPSKQNEPDDLPF